MPLRTLVLVLVAVVLAVFVAANWTAFMTPATLSLLFATVEAPLGLIMLVISGLLAAVFLAYVAYLQGSVLLETRRMTRELKSQRELADQAEASRFTELRVLLEARLDQLNALLAGERTQRTVELARLGDELRLAMEQSANGIAAHIGELEDRLGREGVDGPKRLSP